MAYTPISQTKKTGGYVPIGQKSDKKTSSEVFRGAFPATQMVRNATAVLPPTPKKPSLGQIAKEFVVPGRGFTDKEIAQAKPTIKDTAIGGAKAIGEIGVGLAGLVQMGGAKLADYIVPGYEPDSANQAREKVLEAVDPFIKPSNAAQAQTMRAADVAGFVVGWTKAGKLDKIKKAIVEVSDVDDARKILRSSELPDDIITKFKLDQKAVAVKTAKEADDFVKDVVNNVAPLPQRGIAVPATQVSSRAETTPTVPVRTAQITQAASPITKLDVEDLKRSPDPVAEVARIKNVDDIELQDSLNSLRQWISSGARGQVDQKTLEGIASVDIKPTEPVTLYRIGDVDDTTFQSWSKIKPTRGEVFAEKTFTPEEILIDTTAPELKILYKDDLEALRVIENFNRTEGEVISKPSSMVKVSPQVVRELPPLSSDFKRAIETKRADKTINEAIRTRYTNAARRPVKEDSALAAAAKKPGNVEGIKKLTGELLTPISSRLMRINPKLKRELRAFEFRVANNTTKNSQEILPLLQATRKMSKDDQAIFDLARKNGDSEVIDALATKYDIQDELNRTRDVLDDIYQRAKAVGMDVQYRKDYFPRMVTNPEKFMAYLRGTEDWGIIQRMLDNAATKKGIKVTDLTPEEQAGLVNNFIRGYGDKVTMAKPGFTQARSINVIDDKLNEFYESADSALSAYVVRMNDEIEGRKFFGKHSKENIGDVRIEDSIGSYVLDLAAKGEIKPDQITEVSDILKSRFHRGKMNGALDVYRNAEYLSTMGSPISAITQIGDLAFSVYNNGIYHTLKGVGKSLFSKNKLSKEALGIENITQEFTKNTMSGRALDRVFKITGMDRMDRLGKETLVNGYLSKLKSQAKNNDEVLKRELDFMFDAEESALAMKELAEGKLTDRTKLLALDRKSVV
jgi:hypothetical protein